MQKYFDMKDKTVPKLRQEWFLAELERLKLEKPVAQIVEKTGFSKGQISKLINKIQYPTPEFLSEFCKSFSIDPKNLETYISDNVGEGRREQAKGQEQPDLKDVVLLMAQNVNTFIASVAEDRTAVKKRLDQVEANLGRHDTAIESLLDWKEVVDDTLEVIAAQLKPLMLSEQSSGAAVRGRKRGN